MAVNEALKQRLTNRAIARAKRPENKFRSRNNIPMKIMKVIDGDTIQGMMPDGRVATVRLNGGGDDWIDTPELASGNQPQEKGAMKAKDDLERSLRNEDGTYKVVLFKAPAAGGKAEDHYGRWLGDLQTGTAESGKTFRSSDRIRANDYGNEKFGDYFKSIGYYMNSTGLAVNRNLGGLLQQMGTPTYVEGADPEKDPLRKTYAALKSSGDWMVKEADQRIAESAHKDPAERAEGTAGQKAKFFIGQLLKNPSILGGKILESSPLIVAGVGGTMTGGPALGTAAMMLSLSGSNYADMRAGGATHEDAMLWGNAAAAGEAIIEQLTLGRLGKIKKGMISLLSKKLPANMRGPVIGTLIAGLEDAAVGMTEETSQNIVNNLAAIQAGTYDGSVFEGGIQAAVEGGILEGVMGRGAYAMGRASGRKAEYDVPAQVLREAVQKTEEKNIDLTVGAARAAIAEGDFRQEDKDAANKALDELIEGHRKGKAGVEIVAEEIGKEIPGTVEATLESGGKDGIVAIPIRKGAWQGQTRPTAETTTDPAQVGTEDVDTKESQTSVKENESEETRKRDEWLDSLTATKRSKVMTKEDFDRRAKRMMGKEGIQSESEVIRSDSETLKESLLEGIEEEGPTREQQFEEMLKLGYTKEQFQAMTKEQAARIIENQEQAAQVTEGEETSWENIELDREGNVTTKGTLIEKLDDKALDSLYKELGLKKYAKVDSSQGKIIRQEKMKEITQEAESRKPMKVQEEQNTVLTLEKSQEIIDSGILKEEKQVDASAPVDDAGMKIDFVLKSKLKLKGQELKNARKMSSIYTTPEGKERVRVGEDVYELNTRKFDKTKLEAMELPDLKKKADGLGIKFDFKQMMKNAQDAAKAKGVGLSGFGKSVKRQIIQAILESANQPTATLIPKKQLLAEEAAAEGKVTTSETVTIVDETKIDADGNPIRRKKKLFATDKPLTSSKLPPVAGKHTKEGGGRDLDADEARRQRREARIEAEAEADERSAMKTELERQEAKRKGTQSHAPDPAPEFDMTEEFDELFQAVENGEKVDQPDLTPAEGKMRRKIAIRIRKEHGKTITYSEANTIAKMLINKIKAMGGDILAPRRWGLPEGLFESQSFAENMNPKSLIEDSVKSFKRSRAKKAWRVWLIKQLKIDKRLKIVPPGTNGKAVNISWWFANQIVAHFKKLGVDIARPESVPGLLKKLPKDIVITMTNFAKDKKTGKLFPAGTTAKRLAQSKSQQIRRNIQTLLADIKARIDAGIYESRAEEGLATQEETNLETASPISRQAQEQLDERGENPDPKEAKRSTKESKKSAKMAELNAWEVKAFKADVTRILNKYGVRVNRSKWLDGGLGLLHQFWGEQRESLADAEYDNTKLIETAKQIFGQTYYNPDSADIFFDGNTVKESVDAMTVAIDIRGYPKYKKFLNDLSPDQRRVIQLAERINSATEGKLKQLKDLADTIERQNAYEGSLAVKAGLIKKSESRRHYISHLWDFNAKAAGKGPRFVQDPTQTHKRVFVEGGIVEGWARGMTLRKTDVVSLALESRSALAMARAGRQMISHGIQMGHFRNAKQKPQGFTMLENTGFYARMSPEGTQLYAEDKLAKKLNNAFRQSALRGVWGVDAMTEMNALLKRSLLFASLFHFRAFVWSAVAGTPQLFSNPFKIHAMGKKAMEMRASDVQNLIYHGLTDFDTLDYDPESVAAASNKAKELAKKAKGDKIWAALERIHKKYEKFLFGNGSKLKMGSALMNLDYFRRKWADKLESGEITEDQLFAEVAARVNSDFGGRDYQREGFNPTALHIARLGLLGYDWTLSNMESAYRAIKGRTATETDIYRRLWLTAAVKMGGLTIVANMMSAALDDEDDFFDNMKSAWDAGGLKFLDVDITPLYKAFNTDDGRDRYLNLWGHFKDVAKWASQSPVKSYRHKSGLFVKPWFEAFSGQDYAGRSFTTSKERKDTGGFFLGKKAEYNPKRDKGFIEPDQFMSFFMSQAGQDLPIPGQLLWEYFRGNENGMDALIQLLGGDVKENYRQ